MLTANNAIKLALGACAVIPACFYVGIAGKEYALSRDFRDDTDGLGYDQATKARVVQLAKERHKTLQQRFMINEKIMSLERKLEAQAQAQNQR